MKRKAATLLSLVMLFTSAGLTPAEHASAAGVELLNFDYDDNVYSSPTWSWLRRTPYTMCRCG